MLSSDKWHHMGLCEQLANLSSEVGRAAKWQGKEEQSFWGAVGRAMDIFDLLQTDTRWNKRRAELDRIHEVFADAVLGGHEYRSTLYDVERYLMPFALRVASSLE